MEEPILVRFRWTAEELLRAQHTHFRHTCRPVFRAALHGLFAFLTLVGLALLRKGIGATLTGAALLGAGIYWFAIRGFLGSWWTRRQFGRRPDRDVEIEWRIGPEGISTQSLLGQSDIAWQAFAKVVKAPDGLLFYPSEAVFLWLPLHGFANAEAFARVGELARAKVPRLYEVS